MPSFCGIVFKCFEVFFPNKKHDLQCKSFLTHPRIMDIFENIPPSSNKVSILFLGFYILEEWPTHKIVRWAFFIKFIDLCYTNASDKSDSKSSNSGFRWIYYSTAD